MSRLMANRHPITGFPDTDFGLYESMRVTNPYDPDGDGLIGNYGDVLKSVNRTRTRAGQMRSQFSNLVGRLGQSGAFGPINAPWNPANPVYSSITGTPMAAPVGTNTSNLFDLVHVSKDPTGKFDTTNRALLDRALAANPNYSSVRNSASEALGAFDNQAGDLGAVRGDTQSLIDKYRALQPSLDAQTLTQSNALGRVYLGANDPGSLAAELARNTEFARNAERNISNRAMRQASYQARLGQAGGAGSSYARAQLMDASGRIGAETAARDADRRRQDTSYLLGAQERNLGRTQDLNTANLMRGQIPIAARQQLLDTEARSALNRLAATGQAVTIDQLTDELSTVGRQMGLTTQALQNYLASNFLGVQKQGEDYPLYISGGGSGGRVNPYFANPNYGDEGFINPNLSRKPGPKLPAWVNRTRAQQGWQRDANGDYTIPGRSAQYIDYPNVGQGYSEIPGNPGQYNLSNDFTGYGDSSSPLYYPGYNDISLGDRQTMEDYYEGNIGTEDLLDYYSGEYDW